MTKKQRILKGKKWRNISDRMRRQYDRARNSYVKGFSTYLCHELDEYDQYIEDRIKEWCHKIATAGNAHRKLKRYNKAKRRSVKFDSLPF